MKTEKASTDYFKLRVSKNGIRLSFDEKKWGWLIISVIIGYGLRQRNIKLPTIEYIPVWNPHFFFLGTWAYLLWKYSYQENVLFKMLTYPSECANRVCVAPGNTEKLQPSCLMSWSLWNCGVSIILSSKSLLNSMGPWTGSSIIWSRESAHMNFFKKSTNVIIPVSQEA